MASNSMQYSTLSPRSPGHILKGDSGADYKLLARIGPPDTDNNQDVWRAVKTEGEQRVAIKALNNRALQSSFNREIEILSRFAEQFGDHAFVPQLLDKGNDESGPYFVMELLDGNDLFTYRMGRKKIDICEAIRFILKTAEGLAALHRMGYVHRDIKPSNIMLVPAGSCEEEQIRIIDFGVAKAISHHAARPTGANELFTKPYAPPEIQDGKAGDARSDIYSLAIVLGELVTGQEPENSPCPCEKMLKAIGNQTLCSAMELCSNEDPGKRPQDMSELAYLLAPFGDAGENLALARRVREVLFSPIPSLEPTTSVASAREGPIPAIREDSGPHIESSGDAQAQSATMLSSGSVLAPKGNTLGQVPATSVHSTPDGLPVWGRSVPVLPAAIIIILVIAAGAGGWVLYDQGRSQPAATAEQGKDAGVEVNKTAESGTGKKDPPPPASTAQPAPSSPPAISSPTSAWSPSSTPTTPKPMPLCGPGVIPPCQK